MKRTIVFGAALTMLMALGMSSSNTTNCCTVTCSEMCMMMIPPSPPRMRPDRIGPNGDQSKNRRGSFGGDRPKVANMLEHVMAVASEIDPELATQLSTICEVDPAAFEKIIRRQGRRFGSLVRLRESDPELFEVKVAELKTDAEIYFVTEQLKRHDLDDPSVQAQLMQLRGLVRAKTALSIRAQSLYIVRLERHLEGLRIRLEDTTSRFDEIVEERVAVLLDQSKEEKTKEAPPSD